MQFRSKWQLVRYGVLWYWLSDSVCLERMVLGRTGNGGALNCLGKVSLTMAWHHRSPRLLIRTGQVWGILIMPGQLYLQVVSRYFMCKPHSASRGGYAVCLHRPTQGWTVGEYILTWQSKLASSTVQPWVGRWRRVSLPLWWQTGRA